MTQKAADRERAIAAAVREYWPGARFTYRDIWAAANEDRNVYVSMSAVHRSIRDAIGKGILERVPDTRPILFQWVWVGSGQAEARASRGGPFGNRPNPLASGGATASPTAALPAAKSPGGNR